MGKLYHVVKPFIPYGLVRKDDPDDWFSSRSANHPSVYNAKGKELSVYYLKDDFTRSSPYSLIYGFFPETFVWDRFNRGLPVHFYAHEAMKNTSKWARKKYGILKESEQITPEDFKWVLNNPERISEFENIFTHSAEVLNKYVNAKFLPANGLWYGRNSTEDEILKNIENGKKKNVCMISSEKTMCHLHKVRKQLAVELDRAGTADVFGNAVGKHLDSKDLVLNEYRYNIAIENDVTPFYFTEKLLDCFASKTVPIYLGATEIDKWFNMDGIIRIEEKDICRIDAILKQCSEKDYLDRIKAIEDNYERVKHFCCIEQYLSEVYGF